MNHLYIKKILFCIFVTNFFTIYNTTTQPIKEGFVTYATSDYFGILKILLDSIKAFSTRPVVAYGINDDIPFSSEEYPLLIKKRINIPKTRAHIFTYKPFIILDSGIHYGVYVDADNIVTEHIDRLFDECRKIGEFPLCPRHASGPNDMGNIMKKLNVSIKSMPYVHAHSLTFSNNCRAFIEEWYQTCRKFARYAHNYDETILNVLLWKYGVTQQLPLYGPYSRYINFYIKDEIKDIIDKNYHQPVLGPCMFHGAKKPQTSRSILNQLIRHAQKKKG